MTDFWNQPGIPLGLEARLRAKAAVPDARFAHAVAARIQAAEQASGRVAARLIAGGTFTAAIVGAIALTGGLGYAPAAGRDVQPLVAYDGGSAQARIVDGGIAAVVSTRITVSGVAALAIGVVDRQGRRLLLTQSSRRGGSVVGDALHGPQTKTVRYAARATGTLPLRLRVPANLLEPEATYWVVVRAGSTSLTIPFRL